MIGFLCVCVDCGVGTETCTDPESFAIGGPTLTAFFFFRVVRNPVFCDFSGGSGPLPPPSGFAHEGQITGAA